MNLPLRIARRYLFAKKSTNVINLITGISVFGICVGTAVLILVLSVFNGFEDLITSMYSSFDPDVKITPAKGKTFAIDEKTLETLKNVEGVLFVSQTLEEVAFFEYKNNQDFGTLKGVDENWQLVTRIDSTVQEGEYVLQNGDRETAVLGLGMRNKLGVNIDDQFSSIAVYLPKREEVSILEQQFRKRLVYPSGTFVIQHEFNNQYVITSIDLARELLGMRDQVSALELKLSVEEGRGQRAVLDRIREVMGDDFEVKNRYQQEETFLRLMKMEKWLSFAIVGLVMLLVVFSMVGALWMIVLEKKKDISILKSMGALDNTVRNIFLNEGILLSLIGVIGGFILALFIYWLQITFGIVRIPGNFVVNAYPVSIRFFDFVVVFFTVLSIGLLASIPPALRAKRMPSVMREE